MEKNAKISQKKIEGILDILETSDNITLKPLKDVKIGEAIASGYSFFNNGELLISIIGIKTKNIIDGTEELMLSVKTKDEKELRSLVVENDDAYVSARKVYNIGENFNKYSMQKNMQKMFKQIKLSIQMRFSKFSHAM